MATSEERIRILKMVHDARITAEEGTRLLTALGRIDAKDDGAGAAKSNGTGQARHVRIRVTDLSTGRANVNIRLPVSLVDTALKIGARFGVDIGDMAPQDLMTMIRSNTPGPIIDVRDEDGGEHVEIMIE